MSRPRLSVSGEPSLLSTCTRGCIVDLHATLFSLTLSKIPSLCHVAMFTGRQSEVLNHRTVTPPEAMLAGPEETVSLLQKELEDVRQELERYKRLLHGRQQEVARLESSSKRVSRVLEKTQQEKRELEARLDKDAERAAAEKLQLNAALAAAESVIHGKDGRVHELEKQLHEVDAERRALQKALQKALWNATLPKWLDDDVICSLATWLDASDVLSLAATCRPLRSTLEEAARQVRQSALQRGFAAEDVDARLQLLAALGELHGAALAEHAGLLLPQLADPEDSVRESVAALVRRLPVAVLLAHGTQLLQLLDSSTEGGLDDANSECVTMAVEMFKRLKRSELATFAPRLVAMLTRSERPGQQAAATLLGTLAPADLGRHALAIVDQLESMNRTGPHRVALEALSKLHVDDVSEEMARRIEQRLGASESWLYRLEVAQALACLGGRYLARHSHALLEQLQQADDFWLRMEAGKALCRLEPLELLPHAAALEQQLRDAEESDVHVRALLQAVGKMPPPVLALHSAVLLQWINDADARVRSAAVHALANLLPSDLAAHASTLVELAEDSDPTVRAAVISALAKLLPADLAAQGEAIVRMLSNAHWTVRQTATRVLGLMSAEALAVHAPTLVKQLQDDDPDVCKTTGQVLASLDAQQLAQHAGALVEMLSTAKGQLRKEALQLVALLPDEELTRHAKPIRAQLERVISDKSSTVPTSVRHSAAEILSRLDKAEILHIAGL